MTGTLASGLRNLFEGLPLDRQNEHVLSLVETANVRIERIVSFGQASPPGFWYDQAEAEWVLVLAGRAGLRFEDEPEPRVLRAGDFVSIPARRRHRVDWTQEDAATIWLAVHYSQGTS